MTRFTLGELPLAMQEQARAQMGIAVPRETKQRKYRNEPVVIDGIRFDSKLEGRCYSWLKARWELREVAWIARQVNFDLEGGVQYRADFVAPLTSGGIEVIDATGVLTQTKRNKLKQMKARHGIDVILWPERKR